MASLRLYTPEDPRQDHPVARRRIHVRRQPTLGAYERATIDSIVDAGLVAHVAFVDEGQPFCIPLLYARVGDEVLIHGSTASRAMRLLADGAPACLTVTLLDGLVLAGTVFDHSANYRSAVLLGTFRLVPETEKLAVLEALVERMLPGRWGEARQPNDLELKATMVLALAIDEASAKVRTGPPDGEDVPSAWTGVVPIETRYGTPQPSSDLPLPASVLALLHSDTAGDAA
jgi:nitroimidazol reductase NimA-like FMN-containing flavoprotein (pyridoxamine 5'-phosphate oxidase superfamily)